MSAMLAESRSDQATAVVDVPSSDRKRVVIIGGGPGGIEHFFEQFAGPMTASWKALGSPMLTPEVQKKLIDSVHTEVGSRTIEELEAERDEVLFGLIELRTKRAETAPHQVAARAG